MAEKKYRTNPRAEGARGYGPTPDADLYQGEKPGVEGWGARERSQQMNNAQLRSLQVMIDAGIDPDHAYLVVIGQHSLTQAEHNQVANNGKGRRAPPRGSSPADLDPLEGAPAGEMPEDRRVDDNFDPVTGKFLGNRKDPTAPRRGDGMGEAEGYRGTIPYGEPGWDQQDPRTAGEKAAGRERMQRGRSGAYNDAVNFYNNPDGYTLEEQRLNAQVLSPKQQEEKRRAEQDAAAELRRKQRKPKYDSQTGELLQDHQLERNGWRQVGPDARKRYTSTGQFEDGSSNGVESQARIDARNGIVRNKDGQVLRMGPDGIPVYGPDRFRNNQRPDVKPKPTAQPQGGGQMSVEPEDMADLNAVPRPPKAYGPQEDNRKPMRKKWSHQTGPAPSSPDFMVSPPAWANPNADQVDQPDEAPAGAGQMAIPPEEGDGYGPPVGGRQLGEGLNGGTDQQREWRIRRIAKTRGVPASVVRQEIEAAEAAGARSGEFGYNSARAWRDPLENARDARDAQTNAANARFKNQAMYGPAGKAMNLVNDAQFSNDPSQAGQWHNFMLAQAMLGPQQPIVDPNAVTAQQGQQAFNLAGRMVSNQQFQQNGPPGLAEAQKQARIDKAHTDFFGDRTYVPMVKAATRDTLEEREAMVMDYVNQYNGSVSEQTVRARLERMRGPAGPQPVQPGPQASGNSGDMVN